MRLIPAACVSLLGIYATFWWYQRAVPMARKRLNIPPIAYLESDPQFIQRKPSDNLIWETVKKGETLYPHDSIRASRLGGAKLRMTESNSVIELEPDSVIVLEEKQGKISLDLVNGGLFVKSDTAKPGEKDKAAPAPALEIKIGGTKLATGNKELEMNIRRDKGGKASVAVVKGEVKAEAAGKVFDLDQGKSGSLDAAKGLETEKILQVSEPSAGAMVDIGSGDIPVQFKWAGVPDDYLVSIESGPSPSLLKKVVGMDVKGSVGKAAYKFPPGEHFWRLNAAKKDQPNLKMSSMVSKITTFAVAPPELSTPAEKESIMMPAKANVVLVRFTWIPNSVFQSYEVKLARAADWSDATILPASADQDEVAAEIANLGSYKWRVIGISKVNQRRVESSVRALTIVREEVKPPPAIPKLRAPEANRELNLTEAQAGVHLQWEAISNAQNYTVKMERLAADGKAYPVEGEQNVSQATHVAKINTVGVYKWNVKASNDVGVSEWSETRTIRVVPTKISLQNAADPKADLAKPYIKLAWGKGPQGVVRWRLGLSPSPNFEAVSWHQATATGIDLVLSKFGTVYAKAEGLGSGDVVLAESDVVTVKVDAPPILSAPELEIPEGQSTLVADANGDLLITWQSVPRSHGYTFNLKNASGLSAIKTETKATKVSAKHLMPGEYSVELATINVLGEVGKTKTFKSAVLVPAVSAVKPPSKIGNFQIK